MSNINVKNFVDIDIIPHIYSKNSGTRETIALFSTEGITKTTVSSLAEAKTLCGYTNPTTISKPNTYAYLEMYFSNGGVSALVSPISAITDLSDAIEALDNKYVVVGYVSSSATASTDYTALKTIATNRAASSTVYGVNQKIILARNNSIEKAATKNFAVKYSSVLGAEMTMAAYLSKIDVYRNSSIYDYMFTVEVIQAEDAISNTNYEAIIAADMNVDITLAGQIRNCGGNCSDGDDLTNGFTRIVLQQTVTDVVLNTLTQKLKNQSGLNKIYSSIANELENYKTSGYLTTDKLWSDEDLFINYNNKKYLIIESGTAIQNGYFIKILPFSELSDTDKGLRKTPPIYVIIAEQYGIRKITINGEAI